MNLPRWFFALAVLFVFTMPILGMDTGPPGDVVIEQTLTNPTDPVFMVEVRETFPGLLPTVLKTGTFLISPDQSQQPGLVASYDPLAFKPTNLLMRSTSEPVKTVALRLWRLEGGVAFRHLSEPAVITRA